MKTAEEIKADLADIEKLYSEKRVSPEDYKHFKNQFEIGLKLHELEADHVAGRVKDEHYDEVKQKLEQKMHYGHLDEENKPAANQAEENKPIEEKPQETQKGGPEYAPRPEDKGTIWNKNLLPGASPDAPIWEQNKSFPGWLGKKASLIAANVPHIITGPVDAVGTILNAANYPVNKVLRKIGLPELPHNRPVGEKIRKGIDTLTGGYTIPTTNFEKNLEAGTKGLIDIAGANKIAKAIAAAGKQVPRFITQMGQIRGPGGKMNVGSTLAGAMTGQQYQNMFPEEPGWKSLLAGAGAGIAPSLIRGVGNIVAQPFRPVSSAGHMATAAQQAEVGSERFRQLHERQQALNETAQGRAATSDIQRRQHESIANEMTSKGPQLKGREIHDVATGALGDVDKNMTTNFNKDMSRIVSEIAPDKPLNLKKVEDLMVKAGLEVPTGGNTEAMLKKIMDLMKINNAPDEFGHIFKKMTGLKQELYDGVNYGNIFAVAQDKTSKGLQKSIAHALKNALEDMHPDVKKMNQTYRTEKKRLAEWTKGAFAHLDPAFKGKPSKAVNYIMEETDPEMFGELRRTMDARDPNIMARIEDSYLHKKHHDAISKHRPNQDIGNNYRALGEELNNRNDVLMKNMSPAAQEKLTRVREALRQTEIGAPNMGVNAPAANDLEGIFRTVARNKYTAPSLLGAAATGAAHLVGLPPKLTGAITAAGKFGYDRLASRLHHNEMLNQGSPAQQLIRAAKQAPEEAVRQAYEGLPQAGARTGMLANILNNMG